MTAPATTTNEPSKSGYWIGLVMLAVAVVGGGALIIIGIVSAVHRAQGSDLGSFDADGESHSFAIDHTGSYRLRHYVLESNAQSIVVEITGPDGPKTVLMSKHYSSTGSENDRRTYYDGTVEGRFQAHHKGTYSFRARASGGAGETFPARISVERYDFAGPVIMIVVGFLGGGLLVVIAVIVLIVTAVRRSNRRQTLMPAPLYGYGPPGGWSVPPGQPGWGPPPPQQWGPPPQQWGPPAPQAGPPPPGAWPPATQSGPPGGWVPPPPTPNPYAPPPPAAGPPPLPDQPPADQPPPLPERDPAGPSGS